jgi:hypothetical protein
MYLDVHIFTYFRHWAAGLSVGHLLRHHSHNSDILQSWALSGIQKVNCETPYSLTRNLALGWLVHWKEKDSSLINVMEEQLQLPCLTTCQRSLGCHRSLKLE